MAEPITIEPQATQLKMAELVEELATESIAAAERSLTLLEIGELTMAFEAKGIAAGLLDASRRLGALLPGFQRHVNDG